MLHINCNIEYVLWKIMGARAIENKAPIGTTLSRIIYFGLERYSTMFATKYNCGNPLVYAPQFASGAMAQFTEEKPPFSPELFAMFMGAVDMPLSQLKIKNPSIYMDLAKSELGFGAKDEVNNSLSHLLIADFFLKLAIRESRFDIKSATLQELTEMIAEKKDMESRT